jgi:hypothetical protein
VAFSRGHAFIAAQHAEVAEIETTLRQLSNLPLDGSEGLPGASPGSQKLPPAPENAPAGTADEMVRMLPRTWP